MGPATTGRDVGWGSFGQWVTGGGGKHFAFKSDIPKRCSGYDPMRTAAVYVRAGLRPGNETVCRGGMGGVRTGWIGVGGRSDKLYQIVRGPKKGKNKTKE